MRKTILAANWKLNKHPKEAFEFIKSLCDDLEEDSLKKIIVFPSALAIDSSLRASIESPLAIGMQNMYYEKSGAFTGENSGLAAKELGVEYVLIGHSERRALFKEKEDWLTKKLDLAHELSLTPMFCVGESLEERESGQTEKILKAQLLSGLKNCKPYAPLVLAYEPVWAIGTGKVASAEQAEEAHKFIRTTVGNLLGLEYADTLCILYGGSVKPENAASLLEKENIDGFLVGGASLELKSFTELAKIVK